MAITAYLALAGLYLVVFELGRVRAVEPGIVRYNWTLPLQMAASAVVVGLTILEVAGRPGPSWQTMAAGASVFIVGAGLRATARRTMGPYWSQQIVIRPHQPLIDRGLYGTIRHPGYVGLMLQIIALPLGTASQRGLMAALVLFVPVVVLRLVLEERVLDADLPGYKEYRRTTAAVFPLTAFWRRLAARTPEAAHSRARLIRVAFGLAGFATAAASFAGWRQENLPIYAMFAVLNVATYFFWVDFPPPITSMILPYMSVITAFVYIGGPAVIGIDYLCRLALLPFFTILGRKGTIRVPPFLAPAVDVFQRPNRILADAHIDSWANHATGATGLAVRALAFQALMQEPFGLGPIAAVGLAELTGYVYWSILNVTLPLPTAKFGGIRGGWSGFALESRVDIAMAVIICQPPLVFFIYYAYHLHGLPLAAFASVAPLGPHYLLQLLSQRLAVLVERNTSLQRTSDALRDANQALEDKARALEEKQEELRDFVYTVTHDLKNPLGAIQITADLLHESDGIALSPEGRDHLQRIVRLAGSTDEMIRDLMEFFKITSQREQATWVALGALVERALDGLEPQIASKDIRVDVGSLPRVWGQQEKLRHVVTNLLSNAVKYVPARSGHVSLSAVSENGHVRFCVEDNGIGISPAYHEGIFDLFARVPGKEQAVEGQVVSGTGVGLAIVKRIVEAHEGRVWVESAPGAGSRFFVELPADRHPS